MAYPVRAVIRPAALAGKTNGRLEPGDLISIPGEGDGYTVQLVAPAARSWAAMVAAARSDGHTLKTSRPGAAYRPYAEQERLFRARYYPVKVWRRGARRWLQRWWVKRREVAVAAVPGTSNHGLGIAVDANMDTGTRRWMLANAHRFGWSWEIQSEPWHVRYFAGDLIPKPVLEYEAKTNRPRTRTKERTVLYFHKVDAAFGLPLAWYEGFGVTSAIGPETAIDWADQGVASLELTAGQVRGMRERASNLVETTADRHWLNLAEVVGL